MHNNQRIWVLRDTYEPKESPYLSAHVDVLTQGAIARSIPIIEAHIEETAAMSLHDLILFRPTQDGELRRSFIQKVHGCAGHWLNKNASFVSTKQSFFKLATQYHIPIPKTWTGLMFQREKPKSNTGFVLKTSKGSQGKGVFFYSTTRQVLQKIQDLQVPVVVQEFIPLHKIEDIRLLMVGTTLCAAMKRVVHTDNKREFRANISLGSAAPLSYVPTEEMISYAQQIMMHTHLDFAGIDLLVHNNKPLFLECNTRPGLHGIIQTDASIGTRAIQMLLSRAMSSARNS